MSLKAGYKGIKKYIADKLNRMNPDDSFATVAEIAEKCDNSVIAPVEDKATCQNPDGYAVGEHFIRNSAFCTVTQAISSGGTLTEGTNYTSGNVAGCLIKQDTFSGKTIETKKSTK